MPHRRRPVLVTGSCGLVGSAVVAALLRRGYRVVATDLESSANLARVKEFAKLARHGTGELDVRWADLTDTDAVDELITSTDLQAIIHLAALIPPRCYQHPDLARAINVDATLHLLQAGAAMTDPPRFVQASSIAVYGPRNPHRADLGLLTADTPVRPLDLYGGHKVECETAVATSSLDWVILRLGGVLGPAMSAADDAMIAFEAILPDDGRLQTVAVDDVATAFANAVITPDTRRIFLIGGDDSHRLGQCEVSRRMSAALGLPFATPGGRPGDPDDDDAWFATDWMDSTDSQRVLAFQRTSFPDLLRQAADHRGLIRHALPVVVPAVRLYMMIRSPYRGRPGRYAAPWDMIRELFGEPGLDGPTCPATSSAPD